MSKPKPQKRFNIGIDARLFGTAQSTGIGTYTEELINNLLKIDKENRYTVFARPDTVQFFPFYSPNLDKKPTPYPHYSYSEQLLFPALHSEGQNSELHPQELLVDKKRWNTLPGFPPSWLLAEVTQTLHTVTGIQRPEPPRNTHPDRYR